MALSARGLALILCLASGAALAAEPEAITPPRLDAPLEVPYPPGAPLREEVTVRVQLTVSETGEVTGVELVQSGGEPFDAAVLAAVRELHFHPALQDGRPVAAVLPFEQHFVSRAVAHEAPRATLEGTVVERGTRRPLADVTLVLTDAAGEHVLTSASDGTFHADVLAGTVKVQISGAGLRRFLQNETLAAGDDLRVRYLVDRERADPYVSVVVGERERTEISRTTLTGREVARLPGTFGDPFRVVSALPGVTQPIALLPLPIVRGESPGNTGVFLDGARLPLLYHLFGGPSVVHPEFIDAVSFMPGGFPVTYGGYTSAIIDGRTRRPAEGERRLDLDLNIAQAGAFARDQLPNSHVTATAAARYGYPGLLLPSFAPGISLGFWDYQARLDGGAPDNAWSVFLFGAQDAVKVAPGPFAVNGPLAKLQTGATLLFHRLDMRLRSGTAERNGTYRLALGYEGATLAGALLSSALDFGSDSQLAAVQLSTRSLVVNPQASWTLPLASFARLHVGADLQLRQIQAESPDVTLNGAPAESGLMVVEPGLLTVAGAFVEVPLEPTSAVQLIAGVRADVYRRGPLTLSSVDPRLTGRFRPSASRDLWLKAVVGRYHQPARLFLPVPGVDESSLSLGLEAATHLGAGIETRLGSGLELEAQAYDDLDPVVFDLQVNPQLKDVLPTPPGENTAPTADLTRLFERRSGRAYGLELIARKRDDGDVFGWISYTLARSERRSGSGWVLFDFDRTHVANAVLGVRLPRNWELGGRALVQSGTPVTTIHGYNTGRTPWEFRADVRIDKRVVWNAWMLDFYVDILNASDTRESGGMGGYFSHRITLPTLGLRAVL